MFKYSPVPNCRGGVKLQGVDILVKFHKKEGVVGFETKHCETPRAFPLMGRGRTHRSVAAVCLKESVREFVLSLRNIYTLAFDHV